MSADECFPYVYVNRDGTVRELHPNEQQYLSTEFRPGDGGRPYVKTNYSERNGWGELSGYLHRSNVGHGIKIHDAPTEDPNRPLGKADQIEWLRKKGLEITEKSDGSFVVSKPKR